MRKIKTFLKNNNNVYGILLMLAHAIAMSSVYVFSKKLTKVLPPDQVTFLYKFSILLMIIPWCFIGGIQKNLTTKHLGTHVARATFSIMGTMCFMYSLEGLAIADVTAITFLEQIIMVCVGLAFFHEKLTSAKMVSIVCGVVAAFMICKPGFKDFNNYYWYLFLALLFWAANNTTIKVLGKTERSKAQLFYVMLFSSIVAFPSAFKHWQPLESWHYKYIAVLAISYLIHSVALFKAFKHSDISTVMPFDYTRLAFSALFGYWLFEEIPGKYSLIGYGIIAFGGIYLIQHEARKKYRHTKNIRVKE